MTGSNGTGGDLSGPLAGMWRDTYRKAAGVAEARAQELLKYHVYTYPHGAGGGGGGAWSLVEKITVSSATERVTFASLPSSGDCLMLVSSGSVLVGDPASGATYGLLFNGDEWPAPSTPKYRYVLDAVPGSPGAASGEPDTDYLDAGVIGVFGASLSGATADAGGGASVCYLPDFRTTRRLTAFADGQQFHGALRAYGTAAVVANHYSVVYDAPGPLTGLAVQCLGSGWQFAPGTTFALYVLRPTGGGGGDGADVTITADASLAVSEGPANTFALAARLSADAGNALSLHGDGLFATDTTGGGGGTGNTTMYTQTGTPTGATNSLWFNPSESA